jgi:hypothetical protein
VAKRVYSFRNYDSLTMRAVAEFVRGFGGPCEVEVRPPRRTLDQNALLWARLSDISKQVDWLVDGELAKIAPDDWKAIFTAALEGENRMARGLNGGTVMLGVSTSRMSKKAMTDLQDLIGAFAAEKGVRFTTKEEPWG